jgi:hypothetical protein
LQPGLPPAAATIQMILALLAGLLVAGAPAVLRLLLVR